MAHLGAGKGELWVVLHQMDNRDPAASTFPDSLLIWPQPGCRDTHTALPWLLLGTSTTPGCLGKADSLGNGATLSKINQRKCNSKMLSFD